MSFVIAENMSNGTALRIVIAYNEKVIQIIKFTDQVRECHPEVGC